jgi:hypothetical protein
MTDAVGAGIAWALGQPSDRFGIDAKCVLADARLVSAEQAALIYADKVSLVRESVLSDGGSESTYGGGTSSVLWTADAVRRLSEHGVAADQSLVARSVEWLAAHQLPDGSWLDNDGNWPRSWYKATNGHLWITVAAVQSRQQAAFDTSAVESRAVRFLARGLEQFSALRSNAVPEAVQIQLGYDRFSLAVAVDTLTACGVEIRSRAAIVSYLSADQSHSGAWEASLDVTQAMAHALLLLAGWRGRAAGGGREVPAGSHTVGGWLESPAERPAAGLNAHGIRGEIPRPPGPTTCRHLHTDPGGKLNHPGFDAHLLRWEGGIHAEEVRRADQGQGGAVGDRAPWRLRQ